MFAVKLGHEKFRILIRTDRYIFLKVVATDNDPAGMDSRLADRPLQYLSVLKCLGHQFIRTFFLTDQFGNFLVGFFKGCTRTFRHHFCQTVRL